MGFYTESADSTPVGPTPPIVELDPVISRTNTPPGGPATGDRYLLSTAPTGAWAGHAQEIAEWSGAAWGYTSGTLNDYVYVTNTLTTYRFNGTIWVVSSAAAILQNGNSFGASGVRIGTNDANPLYFKTNNAIRVKISATGNFGIGTLAPGGKFNVVHATSGEFQVYDNGYLKNSYNANNYMEYAPASGTPLLMYTSSATITGFRANNSGTILDMVCGSTSMYVAYNAYLDWYTNTSNPPVARFNSSGNFGFGTGSGTIDGRMHIVGVGSTSATYCLVTQDSGNNPLFSVRNDGLISMPLVQTGNAGLSSGDLYFDTAANILANGDEVCGRKV